MTYSWLIMDEETDSIMRLALTPEQMLAIASNWTETFGTVVETEEHATPDQVFLHHAGQSLMMFLTMQHTFINAPKCLHCHRMLTYDEIVDENHRGFCSDHTPFRRALNAANAEAGAFASGSGNYLQVGKLEEWLMQDFDINQQEAVTIAGLVDHQWQEAHK